MADSATAPANELFELWDNRAPFPAHDEMPDLDIVTHVTVERGTPEGYHYLHESALAWHRNTLFLGWANHRESETNTDNELLRGTWSVDGGMNWSTPQIWAAPPTLGAESINHPVLCSHEGRLWGFFTCWNAKTPRTEVFTMDEASGRWEPRDARIPGFVPFHPPMKMRDGNWIMGGEETWFEAAVAISRGDDFTHWELVRLPRPEGLELLFPETALIDQGDRLIAVCRPRKMPTAPLSISTDCGRTWSPLRLSNFPLSDSQPCAGRLSTGQHFLITNNREEKRTLLSIAVTAPGARVFSRVWKIRHQAFPKRRLFPGCIMPGHTGASRVGTATEWSYPSAVERNGKLYVSYTHGKEDCVMSILPLKSLVWQM